jgi:hypothetical protein
LSSWGALSDQRGWVYHLSIVSVFVIFARLYINIYISIYSRTVNCGKYVQYVQSLCQYMLCDAGHALSYSVCAMTTASHLNGRWPDRIPVKPFIFSVPGFASSYIANIWVNVILYEVRHKDNSKYKMPRYHYKFYNYFDITLKF